MAAEGMLRARLHACFWNQGADLRSNRRRFALSGVGALSATGLRESARICERASMDKTNRGVLVLLVIALGCRPPITISRQLQSGPQAIGCQPADCGDPDQVIAVSFLGVAGLLIEHQHHVLLTAPFFSAPSFGQVRPRVTRLLRSTPRIAPDTNAIEKLLPRSADRATTILVGHGHYDHLMDVPYIA